MTSRPASLKTAFCAAIGIAAATAAGLYLSHQDGNPAENGKQNAAQPDETYYDPYPYHPPIDASDFFSYGR